MTIERLTVTALVDTGSADVFGLEGLEPRVVARAFRLLLQEMAMPGTTIGSTMAVISADGPNALADQAGTLWRAERSMAQNERDRDAAAAIADELAARPDPDIAEGSRVRVSQGMPRQAVAFVGMTGTIEEYSPANRPRPWRVRLDPPHGGAAWFALGELEPLT